MSDESKKVKPYDAEAEAVVQKVADEKEKIWARDDARRVEAEQAQMDEGEEPEVDLSTLEMATIDDFDLSDLKEEYVEFAYPDFRRVIRDQFKWDSDYFPTKYLTPKKIKIRRLTIRDQEGVAAKVSAVLKRKGFRQAKKGDYDETAFMLERSVEPHAESTYYKSMLIVQFLWFAQQLMKAQGFGKETFENLRSELTSETQG
jgi:hypothetical protein